MGDRLATLDMGQNWGGCFPFRWRAESPCNNAAWARAEAYLDTKWHLDPSNPLATTNMGRKPGAVPPFWVGEAGSPSNTISIGSRPIFLPSGILIHRAIWPPQIWTENWGLCPFGGGGPGSPCNKMWPGPRPTCKPSVILIRPTVWPQYTNVTDRTDRTDRPDRQDRQTDNGLIA